MYKTTDNKTEGLNQSQPRTPHTGDKGNLNGSILDNMSKFLWAAPKQRCPSMCKKAGT